MLYRDTLHFTSNLLSGQQQNSNASDTSKYDRWVLRLLVGWNLIITLNTLILISLEFSHKIVQQLFIENSFRFCSFIKLTSTINISLLIEKKS